MCPRSAPNGGSDRSTTGQSHGWRASRPVGRVLCTRVSGPTAIHLGLPLPTASCGLPASIGRAALKRSRRKRTPTVPLPSWPCSGWGLPSRPGHPGRWWSLTPPFHPYLSGPASGRTGAAVCFLWHCPAGHPGSALPTTLPCGARTFLTAHRAARPPGRLARHRKDMLPGPADHEHRRFSVAAAEKRRLWPQSEAAGAGTVASAPAGAGSTDGCRRDSGGAKARPAARQANGTTGRTYR
jgi:hypothetical protein